MPTVRQYLESSWKDEALLAESVPHLLHWDLSYLWVLTRERSLRPDSWRARVQGWERLLQLFLAGRLTIETQEIPAPFSSYTQPFGIRAIHKLHLGKPGEGRLLGVLSPAVLLRPLPDLTEGELESIPALRPEEQAVARYFLQLLLDQLAILVDREGSVGAGTQRKLQYDLLNLLRSQQTALPPSGDGRAYASISVPVELLRTISFRADDETAVDSVDVHVWGQVTPPERQFVPRCESAGCGALLTGEDSPSAAVPVSGEHVELRCPSGHLNRIPLSKFFIWWRERAGLMPEYICWTDRPGSFAAIENAAEVAWPPQVHTDGDQASFRWNPGVLGGETRRVALRLKFPNAGLLRASAAQDALYEKLLIPGGDPRRHSGLPVRWQWRDALESAAVEPVTNCVSYLGIQLRGLPFRFRKDYTELSLDRQPELASGVYPKPMHPGWKPYRGVLLGPGAAMWRVRAGDGQGAISEMQETSGWPGWMAVESPDAKCGSSWDLRREAPRAGEVAAGRLRIGVDFGTTNSVVYFAMEGSTGVETARNSVQLSDFANQMHWLHPRPDPLPANWFLPKRPEPGQDASLVPSALWMTDESNGFLRWSDAPRTDARVEYGFKWDDNLQNRANLRLLYLRELFFFALPVILDRLGARTSVPALDLGFAYPLAFSHRQRSAHQRMIDELRSWCVGEAGFDANAWSINESLAAVRAYGSPNPRELFLVADMGGRTLDLALLAYKPQIHPTDFEREDPFQIGSLDFGGELFLRSVAEKKAGASAGDDFAGEYWRLRDAVQDGSASGRLQGDTIVRSVLDRFQVMALEYIRTMLRAFAENGGAGETIPSETRPVNVLLIGNGWRLRDLRAGDEAPDEHFRGYSERMVKAFGLPDVSVRQPSIAGIRSSKHWVALGALKCAGQGQTRELADSNPYPVRLPAGRKVDFAQAVIEWNTLVGSGGFEFPNEDAARSGRIDCEFERDPDTAAAWQALLDVAIRPADRKPDPASLREDLIRNIDNGRLLRGPLQIALENYWKKKI